MADNSVFLYNLDVGDKFTTTLDKNKVFEITGRKGDTTYVKEVKTGKETWFGTPDAFVIPVDESATYQKKRFKEPAYMYEERVYKGRLSDLKSGDRFRFLPSSKNEQVFEVDGTSSTEVFAHDVTTKYLWPEKFNKSSPIDVYVIKESAATQKIRTADDLYNWMVEYMRKNKSKGSTALQFLFGNGNNIIISWDFKNNRGIEHDNDKETLTEFVYKFMDPVIKARGISDIFEVDPDTGRFRQIKESSKGKRSMKHLKEAEERKRDYLAIVKRFRSDITKYIDMCESAIEHGRKIDNYQRDLGQDYATVFAAEMLRYNLAVENKKLVESKRVLKEDGPQKIVIKNPWGVEVKDYKAGDPIPAGVKFKIFNAKDTQKIEDYADSLFESTIYIKKGNQYFASLDGLPTWSNVKDLAMKYKSKDEAEKERQDLLNSFGYRDRELEVIEEGRIARGYENLDASEKAKHLLSHPCSKYMGDLKSDNITERAIRKAVKEMLGKPTKEDPEFVDVVNEELVRVNFFTKKGPLLVYKDGASSTNAKDFSSWEDAEKEKDAIFAKLGKKHPDIYANISSFDSPTSTMKRGKQYGLNEEGEAAPVASTTTADVANPELPLKLKEGYEVIFPTGASQKLKTIADVNKFVNGVLHMKDKNASDVQLTDDMLDKWNKENDIPLVIVKESSKRSSKKISEGYRLVDQSTGASKSFSTIEELEKYIDDDQGLLEFPIKNDSDITRWNHWQKRDMGKDALQIVKESKKKTLKEESWSEINSIINDDVEEVEDEEGMNTAKRFKDAIYHGKNITPETYIRISKNMRKSGSDNFWDLVEAVLSSDSSKIEKLIAKYDK